MFFLLLKDDSVVSVKNQGHFAENFEEESYLLECLFIPVIYVGF